MPETLSLEKVVPLIQHHFPEMAGAIAKPLGQGWDNRAFLVEGAVFRFPKHSLGLRRLKNEAEVMPRLASQLPLPVPRPRWWAWAPVPFMGYPCLSGDTACHLGLSEKERMALAPVLGETLACLHGLDISSGPLAKIRHDDRRRLQPDARLPLARERLRQADHLDLLPHPQPWLDMLAESIALGFDEEPRTCLLHGDLYVRHLLIDQQRRLCGLIDWGDMHLGDPALDLEIIHHFLPKQAHPAFFAAYGAISDATWHRARFRAIYHAVVLLVYAHEASDEPLKREMQQALLHLL